MRRVLSVSAVLTILGMSLGAQSQAPPPGSPAPAPRAPLATFDTTKPAKLEITEAKARYKVQEQLVGIAFMNDAVGSTDKVTGTIVFAPNGSLASQSKITVDLRTLTSDQEMRDGYIRRNTLDTEKFPMLEFVPKVAQGLTGALPSPAQPQAIGFQLVGDMTLRGVTKPVTWNVAGTLRGETVAGRATTTIAFADFNLPKPSVPLLLSADDKIQLEVEFRCTRSAM